MRRSSPPARRLGASGAGSARVGPVGSAGAWLPRSLRRAPRRPDLAGCTGLDGPARHARGHRRASCRRVGGVRRGSPAARRPSSSACSGCGATWATTCGCASRVGWTTASGSGSSSRRCTCRARCGCSRWVLPYPDLVRFLNLYYMSLHLTSMAIFLAWMWWRYRDDYPRARTLVAVTTLLCMLVQFIPVAPPRMFPELGFVDTAHAVRPVGLRLGRQRGRQPAGGDAVRARGLGRDPRVVRLAGDVRADPLPDLVPRA